MIKPLEIVRGTTNTFGITVTDSEGNAMTLSSGQVLVFGLKRKPYNEERALVKKITHTIGAGEYYLELEPEDTAELDPGPYLYDVSLQSGDAFYSVIEPSPFLIKPNVTQIGDGT